MLVDRQRLAGESRFVGLRGSVHDRGIRRDDVATLHGDEVAGDERLRVQGRPLAVAVDLGLLGHAFLQRLDGAHGLVLLPEPDHAVQDQEREDDGEVRPPARGRGEDRAASIIHGMGPQKCEPISSSRLCRFSWIALGPYRRRRASASSVLSPWSWRSASSDRRSSSER